jgi:CO/xanthine dehydrogenase Mo-binding subunit
MATSLVGSRIKRREDPRLIMGRGTYVDDIQLHTHDLRRHSAQSLCPCQDS